MLSIQLFGQPQLRIVLSGSDGSGSDGANAALDVARRKSRALLYYVAAQSAPVPRDHLLALVWPDLDRAAAQQSLRVALHGLRRALPEHFVAEGEAVGLVDVEVDVRRFEARLSPPTRDVVELQATLDLYRGDFLDGFGLPDSPAFDDWRDAERERYRRLLVRGLTALAEEHEAAGAPAAALEALDRALGLDPLQEDLQREAIRLQYLAGDRAGTIRRYERLRRLLDDELGVPPMAETRALYDSIVADERQSATRPATVPLARRARATAQTPLAAAPLPFVGRGAELEALGRLLQRKRRALVLIEGEPGLGKTRLAAEFVRRDDLLVVAGAAHELDRALPYQPIVEGMRALLGRPDWPSLQAAVDAALPKIWLSELARLLPELAPGGAERPRRPAEEWRLWEAVNQLLNALARARPVALLIDDLHWADATTLGMLGYLVRQDAVAPVHFMATVSQLAPRTPLATLLQTLARDERLARVPLARLKPEAIVSLARAVSPTYAHPLASWLDETSEGNPYVLVETLRNARERGLLLPDGTVNLDALAHSKVVPSTVYSLIQSRLERLAEPPRRVLEAAAVIGREFDFDVVHRAAGLSESATLDSLDALQESGLIQPRNAAIFAFDHNLTVEVVRREMGAPRERLIHRRVAEALESLHGLHGAAPSPDAGLIASHFAEGGDPARGAPYALEAGRRASGLGAWAEAIGFYEAALAGTTGADRVAILLQLGDARWRAGRSPEASDAFRETLAAAAARGDAAAVDEARLALANSLMTQARFAEAVALARQVLEAGRSSSASQAEFQMGAALSVEGADLAAATSHLEKAEAIRARSSPADPLGLAEVKFELGSVAAQEGNLDRAIALYRESLETARRAPDEDAAAPRIVLALNNLGYHLLLQGDPSAETHALAGLDLAREKGLLTLAPYLLSTLGEIALARGDLAQAEARFAEGLTLAEQVGVPERVAGLTANLGLVAQRRGETALAVHRLSTALAQADSLGTRHLAAQIRIWLAPLLPPAEARAHLLEARAIAEIGNRRRLLAEVAELESRLLSG